jgi:hypothetical protein
MLFQALPKLKCIDKIGNRKVRTRIKQFFWILSISRNAIVVLLSATLAYFLTTEGQVGEQFH